MKKLFYLFALVYACVSLVSCEEEDNAIKLTINTSVYDVVKDLKDAKRMSCPTVSGFVFLFWL